MPPDYGSCEPLISAAQDRILKSASESSRSSIHLSTPIMRRAKATTYIIPKRYIFSLLSFSACCLAVSFNVNLSIAIVSMVDHQKDDLMKNLTYAIDNSSGLIQESNFLEENVSDSAKLNSNLLDWNSKIEGLALGAVYYGQLVSFIPGGRMAELYGGKRMIIVCTMISALATLILPMAAFWHPIAFIVTRVAVGIGTGPIIPIVFYMLAKWIPEQERSFHASFIISGYGIGSFLAVIVSGAMCGSSFLGGWPSVFYVGGLFGLLWCFVCMYAMCETPASHADMSQEEYFYILSGLGTHRKERISSIPWRKMALSVPLWALAIGFFGQFWLLGFFSTVHSLYMATVLNLPVVKNGLLSCLPHLLRAFATCIASYPVDLLLKRKSVSVGFVRKGATVINTVVSCGAFLGITYVGREVTTTTILFILGGILGEFVTFGVCLACIDIAPNLSGTVSGITNIVGVFPFFLIPALVGWMTNFELALFEWSSSSSVARQSWVDPGFLKKIRPVSPSARNSLPISDLYCRKVLLEAVNPPQSGSASFSNSSWLSQKDFFFCRSVIVHTHNVPGPFHALDLMILQNVRFSE